VAFNKPHLDVFRITITKSINAATVNDDDALIAQYTASNSASNSNAADARLPLTIANNEQIKDINNSKVLAIARRAKTTITPPLLND
jgi:hypothetical protein